MELVINLQPIPGEALYKTLARAIKNAIAEGRLKPGQPVPSVRALAHACSLSKTTVLRAYEELASQGFIETNVGSGTIVGKRIPVVAPPHGGNDAAAPHVPPGQRSAFAERLLELVEPMPLDNMSDEMNFAISSPDQIPLKHWERILVKHCRFDDPSSFAKMGDPFGYYPLRQAIAAYLSRARAVRTTPERIAIFSGFQPAIDLICRLVIDPGDSVAVENPCYSGTRRTFAVHGASIHAIDVDGEGMKVAAVENLENCKLVYVTPSHQDPTGAVMSPERRNALLAWAQRTGCLIWEDDYDSEYRYEGASVPALQGSDDQGSVVYFSSFWKTLGPVVRLGFAVMPAWLADMVARARSIVEPAAPVLEQLALADFITEGHLEKHIHRTRASHGKRRQALIYELTLGLGKLIGLPRETSGMHLLARFSPDIADDAILAAAAESQLSIMSTREYYFNAPFANEFLIAFGQGDEATVRAAAASFARGLRARL